MSGDGEIPLGTGGWCWGGEEESLKAHTHTPIFSIESADFGIKLAVSSGRIG